MNHALGSEIAIKRWNAFADTYAKKHTEQGDLHKEVFLNPTLFSLIGEVTNKRILDAGCGEGYFSRLLSKQGARVTAVDASSRMLEIAAERTPAELFIHYQLGNCENLHELEDNQFDLVVSNMVIQDLEDFESAFQEINRLLVDNGSFIFSILHPCFVTPGSGWEKTDSGEKRYWKVDNYFYEGVYEQPMGDKEKMLFFHRTLTTYMETIHKTGFLVEKLVEPKPANKMLEKHPSFEEDLRCPDFLVFKLRKQV
ncbi:class I SAM-dependent methyltransferase [Bacillus weihaiensis]|uniref:Methyltransferase n=1 Tax=Bacillus weihaiensis TaxID=1547283 RepID=A0A1L3MRI0_9BACI|nr:class I SAM-dependent methyltransferase [Bacillus weihaiensis]APH04943.1 methyltransferase [Bacillus weihaiensis]